LETVKDGLSPRIQAIASMFDGANVPPRPSAQIVQEMWEKWVGLASLAGATCLM